MTERHAPGHRACGDLHARRRSSVYPVLLMTVLCFVVFACSFNLLLGYAGLLCFGHAMFFGGGAYITGYVLKTTAVPVEVGTSGGSPLRRFSASRDGLARGAAHGIQFAMITLAIAQFVYFMLLQASVHRRRGRHAGAFRATPVARHDRRLEASSIFYYVILAIYGGVDAFGFYRIVHSPFGEMLQGDPRQRGARGIARLQSGNASS